MKRIALVATGGTIAGRAHAAHDASHYTAAVLSPDELLAACPQIGQLAEIVPESPYAIDSKDITPAHWLILARRLAVLIDDPGIDGIVVTHGTDTVEETAWFLHLTLPAGKPVVLTCAMRPANAADADGPANLTQAVALAVSGLTAELGVVLACHGEIHAAREVSKRHTQALDAFVSPENGPLGRTDPPRLSRPACEPDAARLPLSGLGALPEVFLIDAPAGASPFALRMLKESSPWELADCSPASVPGVVLALPGNGSLPEAWRADVEALLAQGTVVVRASRTGAGKVSVKPDVPGLAAGTLTPQKARIALMLALASGSPDTFGQLARAS